MDKNFDNDNAVKNSTAESESANVDNSESVEAKDSSSSSWWNGFIESAKSHTATTLNLIRNDLNEFSTVMSCEITDTARKSFQKSTDSDNKDNNEDLAGTKQDSENPFYQGFGSLWTGISNVMYTPPDDKDEVVLKIQSGSEPVFDRYQTNLRKLQENPETYLSIPMTNSEKEKENFESWSSEFFSLDDKKLEMTQLLSENSNLRSIYTQLVPSKVSNCEFWSRYFYRVHLLDEEEKHRQMILSKIDETAEPNQDWPDDFVEDNNPQVTNVIVESSEKAPLESESKTTSSETSSSKSSTNGWEHVSNVAEICVAEAEDQGKELDDNKEKDQSTPEPEQVEESLKNSNEDWGNLDDDDIELTDEQKKLFQEKIKSGEFKPNSDDPSADWDSWD